MVLPNFLIPGEMKGGTSWLSQNLQRHPEIFMPRQEGRFFGNSEKYSRGFKEYEKLFEEAQGAKAIGEKSANYIVREEALLRIKEKLPDIKMMLVIRNPVDRLISHINHHMRYGDVNPFLADGYDNFISSNAFQQLDQTFFITERGYYLKNIQRIYKLFPKDHIMVIVNESDIRKTPEKTLSKACEFLGVDPTFQFEKSRKLIHKNRNSKFGAFLAYKLPNLKRVMLRLDSTLARGSMKAYQPSEADLQQLYDLYDEPNKALFEHLGCPMPMKWKHPSDRETAKTSDKVLIGS